MVALHVGTKSSPFKDGTGELTVVTIHLALSVVTSEECVDEWHPCLYSEVRVSNLRQNTDEPCGIFVVFLRPSKNAGIIPPLFSDAFLPHHFQTIIHLSSYHSTLYSQGIDFVVKWNKKRYLLSDCVIILSNYSFSNTVSLSLFRYNDKQKPRLCSGSADITVKPQVKSNKT
jgi:hypothetical protein